VRGARPARREIGHDELGADVRGCSELGLAPGSCPRKREEGVGGGAGCNYGGRMHMRGGGEVFKGGLHGRWDARNGRRSIEGMVHV
jgi:hypothetical protein